MPAVGETLRVDGLRELQHAFKLADKTLERELRATLREVAEPVRADAERLAVAGIPTIGLAWSRMRVGVTRTSVYVAPRQRGVRGNASRKRPNLASLLLGRAMLPALERNEPQVAIEMDRMLATVGRAWERA